MLSRIADSLFWLNRYMERADGLLRVARTNYILSLDKDVNNDLTWRSVLEIFTYADEATIAALENDTEAVLKLLITDTSNINALKVLLTKARENARGVQDHITKEVWEQVNFMYHMVNDPELDQKLSGSQALETLERFLKNSLLLSGIIDITMPRGPGWNFMNLGRLIERCTQTIEIAEKEYRSIQFDLSHSFDIMHWRCMLLSLSGYELHLKTYHTTNAGKDALHQVLINENFPRSVIYSLSRINRYLDEVIKENKIQGNETLQKYFGRVYSSVKYADFDTLNGIALQHFLQNVRENVLGFSTQLAQNFFSYS